MKTDKEILACINKAFDNEAAFLQHFMMDCFDGCLLDFDILDQNLLIRFIMECWNEDHSELADRYIEINTEDFLKWCEEI